MSRILRIASCVWLLGVSALAAAPARAEDEEPPVVYWRAINLAPGEKLAIRKSPDRDAAIVGYIPRRGEGILSLNKCEGRGDDPEAVRGRTPKKFWCKIEYKGLQGWVVRGNLATDF